MALEMMLGQIALGIEVGGYLDTRFQTGDNEEVSISNKAKLEITDKADSYYMMIAAQGFYEDKAEERDEEAVNEFKLSRAYLDLYRSWGKTTLGLQNLAWGSGYYFNLPDLFNAPDPVDPKGEKEGINALEVKWNINPVSFGEVVFLPEKDLGESNYGVRIKYNLGLYDLIINHVKKLNPNDSLRKREATIVECRGELGERLPGIWLQTAYNNDTENDGVATRYYSYVAGADHTFRWGNGVYWVAEYCRGGIIEDSEQLFFSTKYDFNSYLAGQMNYLHDLNTGGDLYSLKVKYYIFEKVELSHTLNYYPDGSAKIGLSDTDVEWEYIFGVKFTF